ncbi:hypothetical protein O9992_08195 [Vibrio lentus]|nr:hypothetical protein [Vibrio lentus]
MKLVETFGISSGNKPEWMMLYFSATARSTSSSSTRWRSFCDFRSEHDLYRRVINNNRLKRLPGKLAAPDIIVRNEKRMLQESVDALLDNGRRGRAIRTSSNKRPLKSLADMIKGKTRSFPSEPS